MSKLYSDEKTREIEVGQIVNWEKENPPEVDTSSLNEGIENIELVSEHFSEISTKVNSTEVMITELSRRKLASMEYFITLEGYTPILRNIAENMGVRIHVASLEDFDSGYSTEASHQVALEGIRDFIKNLWKKLKDLMSRFFRKIREFARRLVNANMEIDSYEKYVPAMISKIKSEKLKLTDNSPTISSKLPSLLAYDGMTGIDSDFLLTNGLRSLDALTETINQQVKYGLKQVASIDLVTFRKTIEEIVNLDYSKQDVSIKLNELKEKLDNTTNTIVKTLLPVPYLANDLPEDAYENLSTSAVTGRLTEMRVYGLSDNLDSHYVLPKQFNAFVAIDPNEKVYSTSTSSYSENVNDHINPLGSIESISRVYDFYKKFTKQINIRELDNIIGDTEKAIDDTIKVMSGKYIVLLEKLDKTTMTNIPDEKFVVHSAVTFFIKHSPDYGNIGMMVRHLPSQLKDYLLSDSVDEATDFIIKNKLTDVFLEELSNAINNTGDRETLGQEFASALNSGGSAFDPEAKKQLKLYLDKTQRFILSFFQALQVLLRGLSGTLIATYTECRYELIRYVYQSVRRYG